MGAWGTGIFDNDDVLDWTAELVESEGTGLLEETIAMVLEEDYIEVDLASNALGAIEILAALQGKPGITIEQQGDAIEGLKDWMRSNSGTGSELLPEAKKALKNIKEDSELNELWKESEEYSVWLDTIADLENRL